MRAAALMVYGLGGTRYDFGDLPRQLQSAGIVPHLVQLPGHESTPTNLNHCTLEMWQEAVRTAYLALQKEYGTVHLVGICMGSLLVCDLAITSQHQSGRLVMLSTPLYLDGWDTPWYSWLRGLHFVLPMLRRWVRVDEKNTFGIKNERLRAIVKKRFERGEGFHYGWIPLQSVWQLDRLRALVSAGIGKVGCPALIIHAEEDEITSKRSATALMQGIPAHLSQQVIVKNSYHMVCIDNDKAQVASEVLRFLG